MSDKENLKSLSSEISSVIIDGKKLVGDLPPRVRGNGKGKPGNKPGVTGNPNGRPRKGDSFAELFRLGGDSMAYDKLDLIMIGRNGEPLTKKQALVNKMYDIAINCEDAKSSINAANVIMNRTDGLPVQTVKTEGENPMLRILMVNSDGDDSNCEFGNGEN